MEQTTDHPHQADACFWPVAPVRFRRNLFQTLKIRLSAIDLATAGGFLRFGERKSMRCTGGNRP